MHGTSGRLASSVISTRLSIITPVFDPPLGAFLACAESVLGQTHPDWQWCLVDDCSTRAEVRDALHDLATRDPRISVRWRDENGGIVAASNDALDLADGDFVVLLDHDDALVPTALADVVAALDGPAGGDVDYLYTDEAHVLADGRESAHFLKPDWSPERFRSSMYTCHLSVLRRAVVDEVGGFRTGFDGSQDHDLILRVTEHIAAHGRRVAHVPVLAYHWRNISSSVSRAVSTLSRAVENGRRAVQEQCDRLGIDATVEHGTVAGCYRVVRRPPAGTSVTIVVPTRLDESAQRPFALAAAPTLRAIAAGPEAAGLHVRLVVARPEGALAELTQLLDDELTPEWHVATVAADWSIAHAVDRALTLYPADVAVVVAPGLVPRIDQTPDWLEAMVGLATSAGAGMAGAMIADRFDTVLHAGWDVPNYRWYELTGRKVGSTTSGNDLLIERECTQVSLAAAALTMAHWREFGHHASGGFDDAGRRLSQALLDHGARTLWTPYARFDRAVAIA
ncbi:MAG: glycosyltransferase [Ilumatobacteraceae bacterium]